MSPLRLLILGGTTEASGLARALADRRDIAPVLSFAGRTETPIPPPIAYRIGGFGGVAALTALLRDQGFAAVVDATHPFAARMSANAVAACHAAGVPLVVYTRPAWQPKPDECWVSVPDIDAAVSTLRDVSSEPMPDPSSREAQTATPSSLPLLDRFASLARRAARAPLAIFLTTGRLDLGKFQAAPRHRYLIRSIDPPDPGDLPLNSEVVLARPPFSVEAETTLMKAHGIDLLVTKNSGGTASAAKLIAARHLRMPVLMIERPPRSGAPELHDLDAVLTWIEAQRRP